MQTFKNKKQLTQIFVNISMMRLIGDNRHLTTQFNSMQLLILLLGNKPSIICNFYKFLFSVFIEKKKKLDSTL